MLPEIAAVMWGAVIWQVVALRRRDSGTRRGVLLVLIALACSFTLDTLAVMKAIDRVGPGANFGRLLADSAGMFLAYAVQSLMLQVTVGEAAAKPARRRRLLLVAVLVLMWVEFLAAPMPTEAINYGEVYQHVPLVAAFIWTFEGYFLLALLDIGRLTLAATKHAARRSSRVGMRLLTSAVAVALVYVVNAVVVTGLRLTSVGVSGLAMWMINLCLETSGILLVAGLTVPAWGPFIGRLLRIPARNRVMKDLDVLWKTVTSPFPETILDPSPGRRVDAELQLASKVIEIQDALRRLEPYFEADARDRAESRAAESELTGAAAEAAIAASVIEAACSAARGSRLALAPAKQGVPDRSSSLGAAAWFAQVGAALKTLDIAGELPKAAV